MGGFVRIVKAAITQYVPLVKELFKAISFKIKSPDINLFGLLIF